MNRAIYRAASGSTLAAIASAAAADEGAILSETFSEAEAPSFFPGARRRCFPRRFFGSPPFDGTSAPPSAARAGADAPRALPTTPRTPPAPSNRGDEARTGLRDPSRATADGFGVRLPDPDATGANARASVAIAREEERSASPASRPLRARAVRRERAGARAVYDGLGSCSREWPRRPARRAKRRFRGRRSAPRPVGHRFPPPRDLQSDFCVLRHAVTSQPVTSCLMERRRGSRCTSALTGLRLSTVRRARGSIRGPRARRARRNSINWDSSRSVP